METPRRPKTNALVKRANRALRKRRARLRRLHTFGLLLLPFSMLVMLPLLLFPVTQPVAFSVLLSVGLLYLFALYQAQRDRVKLAKSAATYRRTILELTKSDSVRAVSPLLDALWHVDAAIAEAVPIALVRLLPRLRPENGNLLNAESRINLSRLLMPSAKASVELKIAAVQALAQIGDGKALKMLEGIAKAAPSPRLNDRLIAAAQEAVPILQARLANLQQESTLLRASAPVAAAPETLLRPASYAETTEPQQLLRASQQDAE